MRKIRTQAQIRPWLMVYRKPMHVPWVQHLENELKENKSPLCDFPSQEAGICR